MPLRPPAALPPLVPPARAARAAAVGRGADGPRRATPGDSAPALARAGSDDATTVRHLAAAVGLRALPADAAPHAAADDPAGHLAGAERAPLARSAAPGVLTAGAPGAGRAYGEALYLAAGALRPRARGEAVEVWVRRTPDGGRLAVARRTAGARTVAIEAQIA